MATKYDQSSATRPVSIRSHTSAFQVHFKHTSSALEMSSVNPPIDLNSSQFLSRNVSWSRNVHRQQPEISEIFIFFYDLLKTPLISTLSAYISKTAR